MKSASISHMFVFLKNKQRKEALMNTNILNQNSHVKSVIAKFQSSEGLPFQSVLSGEEFLSRLEEISYSERYNFYSPDITLYLFLSQVLGKETLDQAVARFMAFNLAQGKPVPSSNTSGYSQARSKLPEDLISDLARESAKMLEEEMPERWLFKGRAVRLLDGSTLSMPDTSENQEEYPQPNTQKKGIGFPIARIVTITSLSSGMLLDLAIGEYSGKGTGEHALLRELLHNFKEGDIAIADAYYPSFFLTAELMRMGVDFIFPMHAGRDYDFRRGDRLGKKDHIVEWKKPKKPEWMNDEEYNNFPEKISIREIEIEKRAKGYRTQKIVIVTSFLDREAINKDEISELYSCRWFVELDLRTLKETMDMGILKGKTPEMVRKEIWAHILAYNLIRKIMAQSAIVHDKNPRELSFTHALNLIISFRDRILLSEENELTYKILLQKISEKEVGNRPGRREPRVVKRRPKAFPRMQKPRHKYSCKRAA